MSELIDPSLAVRLPSCSMMLGNTPRRTEEYADKLQKWDEIELDSPLEMKRNFLYSPITTLGSTENARLESALNSKSLKFNFEEFDFSPRRSPRLNNMEPIFDGLETFA